MEWFFLSCQILINCTNSLLKYQVDIFLFRETHDHHWVNWNDCLFTRCFKQSRCICQHVCFCFINIYTSNGQKHIFVLGESMNLSNTIYIYFLRIRLLVCQLVQVCSVETVEPRSSMYITYMLVSKSTPLAVTGPHGQLASFTFFATASVVDGIKSVQSLCVSVHYSAL